MEGLIKEICTPRERREAVCDLLHFKHNPQRIYMLYYNITDPFPSDHIHNYIENDENIKGYDLEKIFSRLTTKKDLKNKIVLITRRDVLKDDKSKKTLEFLFDRGVVIWYNSRVHAKTILMQKKDNHVLYVTSSNLTHKGTNKKHELGAILSSTEKFSATQQYINSILNNKAETKPEEGDFYV